MALGDGLDRDRRPVGSVVEVQDPEFVVAAGGFENSALDDETPAG